MSFLSRVGSATVLACSLSGGLRAAEPRLPAPSTWALNAAKSDFGGIPGMKSDVWHILVADSKHFRYTDVLTLDSGQVIRDNWDGAADGTLRPSPGGAGAKMGYHLTKETMHAEMADGSSMDGAMSLSPDGKTLTVKNDVHAKDGSVAHQTLVYERTK